MHLVLIYLPMESTGHISKCI